MEKHFEDLIEIRKHFIGFLTQFELKRLIYIPMGFKNHIFWNCAHALVTQQLMTYYLTGNEMIVEREWVMRFKKGTFGDQEISQDDVSKLIHLLQETPKQLQTDYFENKLSFFNSYETSFGIRLESVQDAIRFNNLHESLHLGYIMAMRKNLP